MGAYAHCWLDDLFVGSSKDDIDLNLISLFRPRDKVIAAAPLGAIPVNLEHYRSALEEDSELQVVYYETDVKTVRDRLEVLGYDMQATEDAFRLWAKAEHVRTLESIRELHERDSHSRDVLEEHYQANANILASLTPQSWLDGLRLIRSSGLKVNHYGRYEGPHEKTLIGYMLSNDWYGFPGCDFFVPLRLAIEACDNGRSLMYDLTDLIWSGYFDYTDDFVSHGLDIAISNYSSKAKTIVLTEGKTDAWILSESLKLLYPHLDDYFSFLDFDSSGFGGGVGNLANVVKAFAGSGIVNNIVALFDNDTAACAACKTLDALSLPDNIAVRRLPTNRLLDSYPTLGPSGLMNIDVNGIAASIELYLGEDVLRGKDGNLMPVQWTGYDRQIKKYQGEVQDKASLHNRFQEKLARRVITGGQEWDDLRSVLKVIFFAFAGKRREAICRLASDYYVS